MTDLNSEPVEFGAARSVDVAEVGRLTLASHPLYTVRHSAIGDCRFDPHLHSTFTVTAILCGRMTTTVGADELIAGAPQCVFTNLSELHSGTSEQVEFVSVGITPELVDEILAEIGFVPGNAEIAFRERLVIDDLISSVARSVKNELAAEQPGRGPMLTALVRQLVIHLVRTHFSVRRSPRIELSRAGPVDRRLRRAIEFMHDNYGRELPLEEIAASAYLSEYHFSRLFKQITGVSPGVYLANVRIERARQLLAGTRLPISEVAARVGYQSQSHFTKVFKAITSVTPRVFRDSATGPAS